MVSGLKYDLLSISQLFDKGNRLWFDETQCVVESVRSSDIVLHGSRLDNVYAINLDYISPMYLSYLKASLDNAWFWHRRFGHASMHTPHKLVKHDLVKGYSLTNMRKTMCVVHVLEISQYEQTFEEFVYLKVLRIVTYGPMWTNLN